MNYTLKSVKHKVREIYNKIYGVVETVVVDESSK